MKETSLGAAGLDTQRKIAAFFAALTVILGGITLAIRSALPVEMGLMLGTTGLTLTTLCLPIAVLSRAYRTPEATILVGPASILAAIVCIGVTYLGVVGQWLLPLLGLASLVAMLSGKRLEPAKAAERAPWLWVVLILLFAVIIVTLVAGTKYSNFFADQLALYGRTDGDIFSIGAIINSMRYYGWPSMAIDGLAPLRYHVGAYALAGRLAALYDRDAILALVATKTLFLTPALVWSVASSGQSIGAVLKRAISARAAIVTALFLSFILPLAGLGNARFDSESMMLGAAIALLLLPMGLTLHEQPRRLHWLIVVLAIPLLCAVKISMGFVWAGVVGYWLLHSYGMKRTGFWIWGAIVGCLFLLGYRMFGDADSMGAHLFGTPFFVERGFSKGNFLMPVTVLIEFVAAFLLLWWWKSRFEFGPGMVRFLMETLAIAAILAVLPGVLMYIPGGNAYYFLVSGDWLALGIVAALLPASIAALGNVLAQIKAWVPIAAGIAAILVLAILDLRTMGRSLDTFASGKALLVTGDMTYYADDKRRVWHKDAKRALHEIGFAKLLWGPLATPPGKALSEEMSAARVAEGKSVAVYVPETNHDYWNLVIDCDGKSLYPIATAGLPMLDGFTPNRMNCPMEIALRGFGTVPPAPLPASVQPVCGRAKERGFSKVLWVDDLHDPNRNRIIDCDNPG